MRWLRLGILSLCLTALAARPAPVLDSPETLDPALTDVLSRYLRFSSAELAELQRGKIVRHVVESTVPGEVTVAGAVRIKAPKADFFDRARDIVRFKQSPDVLQIGRFSDPPVLEDLAPLTVDKNDFDARACRVGDCGIRLPADLIMRSQHEIDPKAPDAQQRAAAWFKRVLFADVSAYASGAPGRMTQYDDDKRPVRPIDDFEGLLKSTPALGALVPGLPEHLDHFPANRLAGAEDFLYWSKEKFGVAPFITVTHVTIVCKPGKTCTMASKDVYSSRYFDASLALTIASDAGNTSDEFFLVYANRARANALKGPLTSLRRALVERRARSGLEENLKNIRARMESAPGRER